MAAMDPVIVPLQDNRVIMAERLDLLGHGAAIVGLVTAAAAAMPPRSLASAALVGVELAAAAALVVAIRAELRGSAETPARVSWLNLIAAMVLLGEWYARWSVGGKLVSAPLVSAIAAGALAFLHPVIHRRRQSRRLLRMDDAGIDMRFGRFRRFSARWSELRAVETLPDGVRFVRADGRERRVSLRMMRNRAEVLDALGAAARRMLPASADAPAPAAVLADG